MQKRSSRRRFLPPFRSKKKRAARAPSSSQHLAMWAANADFPVPASSRSQNICSVPSLEFFHSEKRSIKANLVPGVRGLILSPRALIEPFNSCDRPVSGHEYYETGINNYSRSVAAAFSAFIDASRIWLCTRRYSRRLDETTSRGRCSHTRRSWKLLSSRASSSDV